MSWTTLFSSIPQETSDAADSMEYIRDLKVASREALVNGHVFDLATQSTQGRHEQGSMYVELGTSEPEASTEKTDHGRIYLNSSTGCIYGAFWDEDIDEIVWKIVGNKSGYYSPGDEDDWEVVSLATIYSTLYAVFNGVTSIIPLSGGLWHFPSTTENITYRFHYVQIVGTELRFGATKFSGSGWDDTNVQTFANLSLTSSSSSDLDCVISVSWDLSGR
jgi:hypothetical protein